MLLVTVFIHSIAGLFNDGNGFYFVIYGSLLKFCAILTALMIVRIKHNVCHGVHAFDKGVSNSH